MLIKDKEVRMDSKSNRYSEGTLSSRISKVLLIGGMVLAIFGLPVGFLMQVPMVWILSMTTMVVAGVVLTR